MCIEHTHKNISEKIQEWYHNILSLRSTEAMQNKEEISELIKDHSDDKLWTLYNLIKSKHCLTFDREEMSDATYRSIKDQTSTDEECRILIYDYAGQSAFYKEKYETAIFYYQKAEKLLHAITDNFEKADFLKRLGISYYRVDEMYLANQYLHRAKSIFSTDTFYKLNELSCRLIQASILSETLEFEEAEKHYTTLLEESLFIPEMNFFCLRSFGLHLLRSNQLEKAERIFTTILCEKEYNLSSSMEQFIIKNKIDLSTVLFRQAKNEIAYSFLKEGMNELTDLNEIEYMCRSKILYHLYVEHDKKAVEDEIDRLSFSNMNIEASELASDTSTFFKQRGQFQEALEFMELAQMLRMKSKIISTKEVSNT